MDIQRKREMLDTDGIINIQEEREAFEDQIKADGYIEFSGYSLEKNELEFYTDERTECAWHAYKLAHRRALEIAIPEGFVLVPKEPTFKMSVAYEKNSIAPISSLSVRGYKAMIEAQEQVG